MSASSSSLSSSSLQSCFQQLPETKGPCDKPTAKSHALKRVLNNQKKRVVKNPRRIQGVLIRKDHSPTVAKTQRCRSCLSAVFNPPLQGLIYGVLKGGVGVVTFLGSPWKSTVQAIRVSLNTTTNSPHLGKAFESLSPWLAAQVQNQLCSVKWGWGVLKYLKEAQVTLQDVIACLLPKMFLNIAKYAKEHALANDTTDSPFTLWDACGVLIGVVESHLTVIRGKYRQLETIEDPLKRERKLQELFMPLSQELLLVIMPEGHKEFPLFFPVILKRYWQHFKDQEFPKVLLSLYRQCAAPLLSEKEQELSKRLKGKELVELAVSAPAALETLLPTLFVLKRSTSSTSEAPSSFSSSIAAQIGEVFNGSAGIKTYLHTWLETQLAALGSLKCSKMGPLWKLLSAYAKPLLVHIFSNLTSTPPSLKLKSGHTLDAIEIIAIKLTTVFSRFFNAYHLEIEKRILECRQLNEDIECDKVLLQILSPLVAKLMEMMGLNESLPLPFFKQALVDYVKKNLGSLILKQYAAIKYDQRNDEPWRQKLRALFFDPKFLRDPQIATTITTLLYNRSSDKSQGMSDFFHQVLWEKSGTEMLVKTIEGMCVHLADRIVDAMGQRLGIAQQRLLHVDHNPFVKQMFDWTKSIVESFLIRSLVQIVETTQEPSVMPQKEHPRTLFGIHMIMRLVNMLSRDLKNIEDKLKTIDQEYGADSKRHSQEIKKAFLPLAADLHGMIAKNPLEILPLDGFPGGENIKDLLWNLVKTDILPDILHKNYQELMLWSHQKQAAFDSLEEQYHTTHLSSACRLLSQYASDFIRHYMTFSHEGLAKLLFLVTKKHFEEACGPDAFVSKTLEEKESEVLALLSQNIRILGSSSEESLEHIWPFLTAYIEAALARFLSGLSSTIHAIETDHPDFMIEMVIKMLKVTSDYFNILNRVAQNHSNEHLYNIAPVALLASFGLDLHPGVPLDPSLPEEEKDRTRLQGWLIPLAEKLMLLVQIKPSDFSLPSSIRKTLGQTINSILVPQILLNLDKVILENRAKDSLILSFINMLHAALNSIESSTKDPIPDAHQEHLNPTRKRLNSSCGMVVLGIVQLIPDTMVQYVFMKEKVKDMSAEAIGNAIMAYLSKRTLLQLIDTLVYQVLPNLHPSRWEGKAGKEVLKPRKLVVQPGGSLAFQSVKKFKFFFPGTPKEIAEDRNRKLKESYQVRKLLRDGFSKTISSQIFVNAWGLMKALWKKFQLGLDAWIAARFPQYGMKIKEQLDPVFHTVFFDVLGPVVAFLGYPLIQLSKFIVEKIHIDGKSEDIIENLHSSSLEHLLYSWVDILVDTLTDLKAPASV